MSGKRKKTPEQPELPIEGAVPEPAKPAANGNGEGALHVQAEEVETPPHRPFSPGNIELPLHRRVDPEVLWSMPRMSFVTERFRI